MLAYQNIELPADALSRDMGEQYPEENKDVPQIWSELKFSMKPYMYSEKLKVDKDDIVMDFFTSTRVVNLIHQFQSRSR